MGARENPLPLREGGGEWPPPDRNVLIVVSNKCRALTSVDFVCGMRSRRPGARG